MRNRVPAVLAGALVALAAAVPGASAAEKHSVTRANGSVKATLSWTGKFERTRKLRIAIDRDGSRALDAKVTSSQCHGPTAGFACLWTFGDHPLELRDIDDDGEDEAIVAVFTGGAHCCVLALVYDWNGSEYVRVENNFLDPGYRIVDLDHDGRYEFLSADARFAYAYGSFAESVFPIAISAFDHGRFEDVTRNFHRAVADDTRRVKRVYQQRVHSRKRIGLRPALAAYIADLYLLGKRPVAKRRLDKALDKGLLGRQNPFDVGPFGRKFIRDLKHQLSRWGY